MISALIVDSNSTASNKLESMLSKYCPQISISETVNNYKDAFNSIELFHPELVFLEVDLTLHQGLEVFNIYFPSSFEVIVLSKTDRYAIHALNRCVSGYLLKPIRKSKLINSVNYACQRISHKKSQLINHSFHNKLNIENTHEEVIGIPTIEGYEFIPIKDIIRCEGMLKCTRVITTEKTDMISSYNLGEFKKHLDQYGFYSPHKSHLINLKMVRKYHKEGNILMLNGSWVPVAKRRKKDFLNHIQHI